MKTDIPLWSYLAEFLKWDKTFQTKVVEKIHTYIHFVFSDPFFFSRKSCRLWDNVEKYSRAGQATDDNMAHVHCLLDTKDYRHTLWICNTPLQQWLHERACLLCYTCITCLLKFSFFDSLWTAISDEANSGVQGVDSIRLDYKEFSGETWGKKTTRMT
jgi:hypothetical protein